MKILVFGGKGFLGLEIESELKNKGYDFYAASRNSMSDYVIDISNSEDFDILPENYFDVVVNCATILPGGNLLDKNYLNKIYSTNILGTQNICNWVVSQKSIKKIINCSTLVVVNKPWEFNLSEETNTYPKGDHVLYCGSKLMQELIVDSIATKYNIDFINIRFSAIYGENMPKSGIIWALFQQAKYNKSIKIINGKNVSFDFINVKDAARVILASIESKKSKGIVNAASGNETTLLELATIIKNIVSESIVIENEEQNDFMMNRSIIDVTKLNSLIETTSFIPLNVGVSKVFAQW